MAVMQLPIDSQDVLSLPPCVVLYGPPGAGKTFEMARAFSNTLYIQSSPSILHAYAHYVKVNPDKKLRLPTRVTLDEATVAKHYGGSIEAAIIGVAEQFIAACDRNDCPYEGIVFDEWNTLCERLYAELKEDRWNRYKGRNGKLNIFAVMDGFKAIHRAILSIARRTRRMVGFVSHYQGPKWDEDPESPTRGQLKWPGGPQMPMGLSSQIVELCADADVVLQLVVKDEKTGGLILELPSIPAAPVEAPVAAPMSTAPLSLSMPAAGGLVLPGLTPAAPMAAPLLSMGSPADKSLAGQRVFMTALDNKWFRKVRGFGGIQKEELLDITQGKGLRELLARAGYPV